MDSIQGISLSAERLTTAALDRFMPEPRNNLGLSFQGVMKGALDAAVNVGSSALAGIDGGYVALLNAQIESQKQMQLVSMESNVEKSRHETQMAAIRNIRVG